MLLQIYVFQITKAIHNRVALASVGIGAVTNISLSNNKSNSHERMGKLRRISIV